MPLHFKAVARPSLLAFGDTVQCLDDNAASEFVSGTLAPLALTRVEGHLAGCRDCRALVAALAHDEPNDSHAATRRRELIEPSQVAQRPTRTFTIGDRVGRYLVLSTLGTGGMGVVFSAYDPQLDRKVALKLLRAGLGVTTKEARTRLRREAQAIAQLSHPNVVGVYDVGETEDGDLYIAMEFVEGDTLTTWLRTWPRTWREIVDVFLQAARGLLAAHSVGLLHRDFKPDNVLVGGDGRVRVTDFGLARSVLAPDDAVRPKAEMTALNLALTATGTVLGTPRYMPPEQLSSPEIDARSDQFSFCVALYEALYGVHPLPGGTSVSMLERNDKAAPPPEGTKVPAFIGRAVLRGLEADRSKRFPTMGALMSELTPRPARAPVRFAALGLALVLAVGGATAAMLSTRGPSSKQVALDDDTKRDFIERLSWLESQRRGLLEQIKILESQRNTEVAGLQRQVADLKQELEEKDHEIQQLVEHITNSPPPKKPLSNRPSPTQSVQVLARVDSALSDIDGCFDEWSPRAQPDVPGLKTPIEANLVVRLSVGPDGTAHSAKANGMENVSVVVPFCVEKALERVKFPTGPEQLDLEVRVQWSEGLLNLAPMVVGHHVARANLDVE
jgi:serine/threonine protein kinase